MLRLGGGTGSTSNVVPLVYLSYGACSAKRLMSSTLSDQIVNMERLIAHENKGADVKWILRVEIKID